MKTTLYRATPMLLLFAATLTSASNATAQTLAISFDDPGPQPINQNFRVYLDYALPAANYQNVQITLPLPDRGDYPTTSYVSHSAPATFTFTNSTSPNGRVETLTFTAPSLSDNQAITGRVTVTLRFASRDTRRDNVANVWTTYQTLSGTPFPLTATLTGESRPGDSGPYTPFSSTANAIRTATGQPTLAWQYTGATFYGAYNTTFGGLPGVVQRYDFRMYVCGNASIRGYDFGSPGTGGMEWTISMPPTGHSAQFHRVWAGDNRGLYPESDVTPSTATHPSFSILTPITGSSLTVRMDSDLIPTLGQCDYSYNLFVDVFVPCEGTNALHIPTLTVTAGPAYQPVWNGVGQPPTLSGPFTLPNGESPNLQFSACGAHKDLVKYWNGDTAPGAEVPWAVVLQPPTGVSAIDDALVIDKIPPGTSNVRAGLNAYLVDFSPWVCANIDTPFFDLAAFDAYRTAGRCVAMTPGLSYLWNAPSPAHLTHGAWTHLVLHAPRWGAQREDSVRSTSFNVYTTVSPDYDSAVLGNLYRNHVQIQGVISGVPFGNIELEEPAAAGLPVNPDIHEAHATRVVLDFACGGLEIRPSDQPAVRELAPGQCSHVRVNTRADPNTMTPINSGIEIQVPDGVTIQWVSSGEPPPRNGIWPQGSCVGGTGTVVEPDPNDRPLVLRFGTEASPCGIAHYSFITYVEFCVDVNRPWVDGQPLDFTATYLPSQREGTVAQCGPYATTYRQQSTQFRLAVPPEMRLNVTPVCAPDSDAAFLVTGINSGGQDLTGLDIRFQVPDDATLAGVDLLQAPGGAIVQVAASDPPTAWLPLEDVTDPRWVRVIDPNAPGLTIPARSPDGISFRVRLSTSATTGTGLVANGAMYATQLGASAAVAEAQPFVVDSCAHVRVEKFFDLDANGVRNPGEPGLADWLFEVVASNGAVIADGTTNASGAGLAFLLPAGTYTVREILPTDGPMTWQPTTPTGSPNASQTAVIAVGAGDVTLLFGNACACPSEDPCTVGRCGYAVADARAGSEPEIACRYEPLCAESDACSASTCVEGECITVSTAVCDPAAHFIPVTDTTTGGRFAIRCVISPAGGPPVCDTNPDGSLTLHPEWANACGGAIAGEVEESLEAQPPRPR